MTMSTIPAKYFDLSSLYDKPVFQKAKSPSKTPSSAQAIAATWIGNFDKAIEEKNASSVSDLFHEDGWWRDTLSLSWDFHTYHSASSIQQMIQRQNTDARGLSNFRLDPSKTIIETTPAPAIGGCMIAYFLFETKVGRGKGIVNLTPTDESGEHWKAFTFYTSLQELKGYEERKGSMRPKGIEHGDRQTWLEKREKMQDMDGVEPTVLVVGSGHSGLNIAARLGMLDISTLIIERNERVGDNWRKRYKTLVLHDPVWYDHLSYMPFPQNWPVYSPKDKLADWFEAYVKAMELNVWTSTNIKGTPTYNPKTRLWTIHLQRGDRTERTLHPRHVILASGHSGEPRIPVFPGANTFKGDIHHSSRHIGGATYRGKRAVIVGCCNSGHDIASDFYDHGAESVTMIQRSSTYVMSQQAVIQRLMGQLYSEDGPPTEDADLFFTSIPYPVLKTIQQYVTQLVAEDDKEMLVGLERAGFKVDYGYEGSGLFMKYLIAGGGYYIDVGCSQMIADGKIKIKQGKEIAKIVKDGIVFEDGSKLEADVIVLATGYDNMRETARKIFGDQLADSVSDVWGFNDEGEIATMWQSIPQSISGLMIESGHEGFWFMGGNLGLARVYSRFLALQIKAVELGLQ